MNTDTRRHAEKSSYHRKSKYKEDLLDNEDLGGGEEKDDQGVMSDFKENETDAGDEPEGSQGRSPGRR